MEIRYATEKDLSLIMEIEKDSFIPEIQEDKEVFLNRIRLFSKGFYLFEQDNCTLGYMSTEKWSKVPENDESFGVGHDIENLFDENGKVLYISSFAIFSRFRGSGLGKKVFAECLRKLKEELNPELIVLFVNENWPGARHIYESSGFKYVKTIKNAFPNGDGIFMELK